MKNKTIYLSSKMTGLKDFGYKNFEDKEIELRNRGFKNIINPNIISRKFGNRKDHAFYMKKAIDLLLKADTLYLFGNWKKSKGARLEYRIAKALKMNIIKGK
jgi:hypothetical protein